MLLIDMIDFFNMGEKCLSFILIRVFFCPAFIFFAREILLFELPLSADDAHSLKPLFISIGVIFIISTYLLIF